jgi:two-component system sensor histidine kinase KdpD
VISTASIGQLDSLSGVVEKITGVAPQQTVPDSVVRAAAEIELVDPAPEMLRDRMASGQIYPPGQAEEALAAWFRLGPLSALHELALLWLAVTRAQDPHQYHPGDHVQDGWRAALLNREVPALRGEGR